MDIVLVSYGSAGDVRPLMALGLALHARGSRVRVCAPPESRPLFVEAGLRFTALGGNVRRLMDARAEQFVGRPLAAIAPMRRALRPEIVAQFRRLPALVKGADLVIGAGLALALPSVAEACRVPFRYAVSIPALLPSRCHAPVMLPWQNLPPLGNRLLWRLASGLIDLNLGPLLNRHRHLLGLRRLTRVLPHLTRKMIVAADRELAPLPPEAPSDCRQTGYWHPPSSDALPPPVDDFLARNPSVVYFGFGSMGDPAPHKTVSILRQAAGRAGVRAIIQSGWAGLHFASDADCLCVTGELPHARLFSRVAAVVHHGGAGTVMTAARAGVPQLIIPHLLDQYFWGHRIYERGLGPPPIPRNRLRPRQLTRALQHMVASPRMGETARTLAVPLRGRDGAREAARWLLSRRGEG